MPNNTQGGSLDVTRIALYSSNIWAALGMATNGVGYDASGSKVYRGDSNDNWDTETYETNTASGQTLTSASRIIFKTLKDQRVPLEIQVKIPMDGQANTFYTETYVDCWLASYSKSYDVGKITVAESCKIDYADVY